LLENYIIMKSNTVIAFLLLPYHAMEGGRYSINNKSRHTIFSKPVNITYCNYYIINLVSLVKLCENDVTITPNS
jgi:hypothetical protein